MKISRKKVVALCIIIPVIALVILLVLYFDKPHFSKYKSYSVITKNGDIPLTDEQFQRIIQVYENDTLHYGWFDSFSGGGKIKLYKSGDMSGEYDLMVTGTIMDFYLMIGTPRNDDSGIYNWKAYYYDKQDTARQVFAIIDEAIAQYKSEQEE